MSGQYLGFTQADTAFETKQFRNKPVVRRGPEKTAKQNLNCPMCGASVAKCTCSVTDLENCFKGLLAEVSQRAAQFEQAMFSAQSIKAILNKRRKV